MGNVITQMSMSLDGYDDASRPGNGVERLHQWMFAGGSGTGRTGAGKEIRGGLEQRSFEKDVTMHHYAIGTDDGEASRCSRR